MSFVYWIHLPEHTDMFSEGYIGVSKDVKKRYREHIHCAKSDGQYPISKAIRKHGGRLLVTVLVEGGDTYCYELEAKLRPTEKIGWNLVEGGGIPPMLGKKHSEDTRKKMSLGVRAAGKTPARVAQFARMQAEKDHEASRQRLLNNPPWMTPHANKSVWLKAKEAYEIFKQNPSWGFIRIESVLGLPKYSLKTMLCKFKQQSWNPSNDQEWSAWFETNQIKEI